MSDNKNENVIDKLMNGMSSFLSTKTVVGEPMIFGDTTLIPLVEVSFGMGAGSGSGEKKDSSCGGIGGKVSPSAVLVLRGGSARLVNVKNQDSVTKILDMVPDIVNKFSEVKGAKGPEFTDKEAVDIAFDRTENQ
ncbi:MAG: GerW family sporulation protein [Lachnospiraceae bacterium]|nr:GerW family sporulation protein [Lachnospiraceae bacterium]